LVDRIKLAIGIPAYGGKLAAEHMRMWIEFGGIMMNSPDRFDLVMSGYFDINPVDRARNMAIAHAMQLGADWLFTIDSDTWVEAYGEGVDMVDAGVQILRMISDAERAGATIVAGPVYRRGLSVDGAASKRELAVYRREFNPGGLAPEKYLPIDMVELPLGLSQVHAVGAACCAINLTKIGEAHYRFTDALSEDLEFCRQVREGELHGKIFVDTRVRTAHLTRPTAIYSREA
jgi:hypothetical protein